MHIRRLIPVLTLAAAALAVPATAASASTTAPAASPATTILGPCTPFEDGHYMVIGRGRNARLYECKFVRGLGYYWVDVPACPGGVSAASGKAARPAC